MWRMVDISDNNNLMVDYFCFDCQNNTVSLVSREKLEAYIGKENLISYLNSNNNSKNLIIPIPEKLKQISRQMAGIGLSQEISCIEETTIFISRVNQIEFDGENETFIQNYIYSISKNILGFEKDSLEHLNNLIKNLKCNREFRSYLNVIKKNLEKRGDRDGNLEVNILYSFKPEDENEKLSIARVVNLINIQKKITINSFYSQNFTDKEIVDLLKMKKNDLMIIIGHGNNESGVNLITNNQPSLYLSTEKLNCIYKGIMNNSQNQSLIIFCCDGKYYGEKLKDLPENLNIGHGEDEISFEHAEYFLYIFLKMLLKNNVSIEDAFNVGKYALSIRSNDFHDIQYYKT